MRLAARRLQLGEELPQLVTIPLVTNDQSWANPRGLLVEGVDHDPRFTGQRGTELAKLAFDFGNLRGIPALWRLPHRARRVDKQDVGVAVLLALGNTNEAGDQDCGDEQDGLQTKHVHPVFSLSGGQRAPRILTCRYDAVKLTVVMQDLCRRCPVSEPVKPVDPFAPDPDAVEPLASGGWVLPASVRPLLIGFSAVAVVIAAVLWIMSILPFAGRVEIHLQGPGVEALDEGALVVLGRQEIGRVSDVVLREGQPTARLLIDGDVARELPRDSSFTVASLNQWLPGNLGVVVKPTTQSRTSQSMQHGAVYRTDSSPLPRSLPMGFYWLAAAGAVVLIVATIFARILKTWLLLLAALAGVVAVLSYLNIHIAP